MHWTKTLTAGHLITWRPGPTRSLTDSLVLGIRGPQDWLAKRITGPVEQGSTSFSAGGDVMSDVVGYIGTSPGPAYKAIPGLLMALTEGCGVDTGREKPCTLMETSVALGLPAHVVAMHPWFSGKGSVSLARVLQFWDHDFSLFREDHAREPWSAL
ncbi:hypothetical protein ABT282_31050 [Streptomyces sp. NPDC000927]|uniref:hypothetical protein n=1 Tax=Streptomyces sp. NPDC000927 TaxID=3154371 RepID=UPI003331ED64